MTPDAFRLAQLHHALTVASSVPDPSDPDVQAYLRKIVTADPAALDPSPAAGNPPPAASTTNPPPSPEKS